MVKKLKIFIFIFCMLPFASGCATPSFEPISLPKANFEQTKKFELKETIKKPEKPDYVLLDKDFNVTTSEEDTVYVAFEQQEFAKLVALSVAFDEQKEVVEQLVVLLNVRIEEINALKELVEVKETLADHLAVLYANEQKIRYEETKSFFRQNLVNKVVIVVQAAALAALLAF